MKKQSGWIEWEEPLRVIYAGPNWFRPIWRLFEYTTVKRICRVSLTLMLIQAICLFVSFFKNGFIPEYDGSPISQWFALIAIPFYMVPIFLFLDPSQDVFEIGSSVGTNLKAMLTTTGVLTGSIFAVGLLRTFFVGVLVGIETTIVLCLALAAIVVVSVLAKYTYIILKIIFKFIFAI